MAGEYRCNLCDETKSNTFLIGQQVLGKDLINVIDNITNIQLRSLNPHVGKLLVCQKCALGLIQAEGMVEKIRRALSNLAVATKIDDVVPNDTTRNLNVNSDSQTKSKDVLKTPKKRKITSGETSLKVKQKLAQESNKSLTASTAELKTTEAQKVEDNSITENGVTAPKQRRESIPKQRKENTPKQRVERTPKQKQKSTEQLKYHFKCEKCSYESDFPELFKEHLSAEHGIEKPRIFKCSQCSESYQVPRTLQQHISYVHDNIKRSRNFACMECDKTFFHRAALQNHSRTHAANGTLVSPLPTISHTCTESGCSKAFGTKAALKCHKTVVHTPPRVEPTDKPLDLHACTLCGKSYSQAEELSAHMDKAHESNQPKEGIDISKTFVAELALKSHKTGVHTPPRVEPTDKPLALHACTLCGKSYSFVEKLRAHMKKAHDDNQSKECPNCGATFRSKEKYEKHIFSEKCNTSKQYPCQSPLCSKSFSKASKMRFHMSKAHAINLDIE